MTKALIVVDVQQDFCEGGSLAVAGGADVAAKINALLQRDHDYAEVVATRDHHIDPGPHFSPDPDYADSWPRHCEVGTPGVDFHPTPDVPRLRCGLRQGRVRRGVLRLRGSQRRRADAGRVALRARCRPGRGLWDRHRLLRTGDGAGCRPGRLRDHRAARPDGRRGPGSAGRHPRRTGARPGCRLDLSNPGGRVSSPSTDQDSSLSRARTVGGATVRKASRQMAFSSSAETVPSSTPSQPRWPT